MASGRPAQQVTLSTEDQNTLKELVRGKKTEQRIVLRARIGLMAAEGYTTEAIAQKVNVSTQTVSEWRGRIATYGIDGIKDKNRSGRPRQIKDTIRLELISLACEPIDLKEGRVTPTLNELMERAVTRGVIPSISRSHLHRILQSGDVRPHRVQQWLHSSDPEFRTKVNIICDLYREAPKDSVVLSIDEKSGIQAIERKNLERPSRPGRLFRQEFEYTRHGTQCLIAALNVHTGKVFGQCRDRRTLVDLLEFMSGIAEVYPTQQIHVVWDNLNTHRSKDVWNKFNSEHGNRFHFHYTPIHASWVNQIELLFGIYSRRVLRNASHTSTNHLRKRTIDFIEKRNQSPTPFKWTFNGFHLQTGEKRTKECLPIKSQPNLGK